MTACLRLRFTSQVHLVEAPQGKVELQEKDRSLPLGELSRPLIAALGLLTQANGVPEPVLVDQVLQTGTWSDLPQLHYLLDQLQGLGVICHCLQAGDRLLATWIPLTSGSRFPKGDPIDPQIPYQLGRFTYSRREDHDLVVETPLAPIQIRLGHPAAGAILALLCRPLSCEQIAALIPDLPLEIIAALLELLVSGQMIEPISASGEPQAPAGLEYWEFHDLVFHSRSRLGRHDLVTGKAYPFLDQIPPPPPLKTYSGRPIPLQRPDLETLKRTDRPLTQVLESRRSQRGQGSEPITVAQLGAFLFRCAHVQGLIWRDHLDCTLRPTPSGGACHPLEIYPVVHRCQGLEPGLYHYDPHQHQLDPVAGATPAVMDLWETARQSTKGYQPTQVLLVLAARFPRVMWVYRSISYALILKDVGALMQTFALVATAMDLAGCSLGVGNGDGFAAAATTEYYLETSVGEFILGSSTDPEAESATGI